MTRRPVDVLLVSLGSTLGLRTSDERFAELLRGLGLSVEVATAARARHVRTLALTDLTEAIAARRAARAALRRVHPRAIVYSTTTAALLWPARGAIRFDALAQRTRPGRHGPWQRPLERRRLRAATALLPVDERSLDGAPAGIAPALVVPIPITPPQPGAPAGGPLLADPAEGRIVAVTYAADPHKKGLDRTRAAWALVRRDGELLAVTGCEAPPPGERPRGTLWPGLLRPEQFRALVRECGVLVIAPRREDYGLVQLEALAEGARVVTCRAPGPYAALPLIERLWPSQVVDDGDDAAALGAALRAAIDAQAVQPQAAEAAAAVAGWSPAAIGERMAGALPAALGLGPARAAPDRP